MLNNKFIAFISLLLFVNCSCSQRVCGVYQEKKELANYELALSCDSIFTLTKNTLPTSLHLKGTWHTNGDNLLLKVGEDSGIKKKVESDTLGELIILPNRKSQWSLSLQDFGAFKIKGKKIETTYKGSRITFSK